jgi:hypothetical protein
VGSTILAGNLVGIYNYILKFVSGLDTIPYTVQRLTSLSDITKRIELQAGDFPEQEERKERNESTAIELPLLIHS